MRELLRRWGTSPGSIALAIVSTLLLSLLSWACLGTQMLPPGHRLSGISWQQVLCLSSVLLPLPIAWMLQERRDRLDREAEKRGHIERGDRIFHVLIQVPQQVGKEDKLRTALDLPTSEVHRGIAPLMEACAPGDSVRIEVRELADIDQDLEVYASDVMRKALHPFGEEKQTYRETAEADGDLTLVTWLLLVQLADAPAALPIQHGALQHHVLRAWLDALIPPHPDDTLSSQVACSPPLGDIEVAEVATIFLRR